MVKIWFLYINDEQEGPYTYLELSKDGRLQADTFAWKEGMEDWMRIAEIDELKGLVGKEKRGREENETDYEDSDLSPDDEIVLEMKNGRPFPWLWVLIVLIILFYAFYEYFWWQ